MSKGEAPVLRGNGHEPLIDYARINKIDPRSVGVPPSVDRPVYPAALRKTLAPLRYELLLAGTVVTGVSSGPSHSAAAAQAVPVA